MARKGERSTGEKLVQSLRKRPPGFLPDMPPAPGEQRSLNEKATKGLGSVKKESK